MTELEFARAHFGDFTIKGDEIVPKLCPYCHGGSHGDKNTFALNLETHVFKCQRGSCGQQGHFSRLLRDFGEQPNRVHTPVVRKAYKRPPRLSIDSGGEVAGYIRTRGITDETAQAYGVGGNEQGEVVFPYFEDVAAFRDKQPTFIKYRPARKLKHGESKARREKDTKPILFGMHLCKPQNGMLYIFEGEFDCMAGYQAHGGNCVSVPSGCKDFTWLETCTDFLARFERIALIGDNDDPGQEMLRELSPKLEAAVYLPDFALYEHCKDANELLFRYGADRLREIMETVKPAPVLGLLNVADVVPVDICGIPRTLSGIPALDKLTGGLYMGDLNVWTGKRGEGKSTLLTQLLLGAVDQGRHVCAYSGEIPAERFKYGLYLQAADSRRVCERTDPETGRSVHYLPCEVRKQIDRWLDGKFWLYDNRIAESDEAESVLRVFEQAYRRYDCRVFLVDNLMTVRACKRESDFYQAQADFTIKLRKFAERFGVAVHLVVHPRKTNGRAVDDNDAVGGLSTITNIACAVFAVRRLDEQEAAENNCDAIVSCLKNRMYGQLGNVPLDFIPRSRRFVQRGQSEKAFSWETDDFIELDDLEEPPF